MTLIALIAIPLIGGLLAWAAEKAGAAISRGITVFTLGFLTGILLKQWANLSGDPGAVLTFQADWIPQFGISLALHQDGLSLMLILLSVLLSIVAVYVSWDSVQERVGAYHFNILWVLSGTIGVFLARDLFLFFFFWELMVVPMAFLIAFWGGDKRSAAATKFFIFTQASGLLMLISTLGLVWMNYQQTGAFSFLLDNLLDSPLAGNRFLMLGFFLAFAVKLPVAPFHAWQADAYTQAPTGGTIILAGFLSKTGGYGLIRYCLPLFPEAAQGFAPWAMGLGVFTVAYGAMLAFGQKDAKRLVAFSSLSHMGFIMIGVFAWNAYGVQGATIFMLSHGFATSALFLLVHMMEKRLGHRDLSQMGGVAKVAPRFAGISILFVMLSLGLPASGNFVGEMLILAGAMQQHVLFATAAGFALILPAIYSLYFIQKSLHGALPSDTLFAELNPKEYFVLALMGLAVLYLGLQPQCVLDTTNPSSPALLAQANLSSTASIDQPVPASLEADPEF